MNVSSLYLPKTSPMSNIPSLLCLKDSNKLLIDYSPILLCSNARSCQPTPFREVGNLASTTSFNCCYKKSILTLNPYWNKTWRGAHFTRPVVQGIKRAISNNDVKLRHMQIGLLYIYSLLRKESGGRAESEDKNGKKRAYIALISLLSCTLCSEGRGYLRPL